MGFPISVTWGVNFFNVLNLQIVPTDNMQPKLDDDYSCHLAVKGKSPEL